jgi:hypothetical protein
MPSLPRPWANLAYLDFVEGDIDRAAEALGPAMFLSPGFCPTRVLLAQIERRNGNEEAADGLEGPCLPGSLHVLSRNASRAGRLYRFRGPVMAGGVLPPGLLRYCEPASFALRKEKP